MECSGKAMSHDFTWNSPDDKYQKPHVFGSKVIYNIYKDLLRVLRY